MLSVGAGLEDQRRDTDKGGDRSQQDWPEAVLRPGYDCLPGRKPRLPEVVDELDHHQRVVDDHAAHADQPVHRPDAQAQAEKQVPGHGTDHPQRDRGQNDQGL